MSSVQGIKRFDEGGDWVCGWEGPGWYVYDFPVPGLVFHLLSGPYPTEAAAEFGEEDRPPEPADIDS